MGVQVKRNPRPRKYATNAERQAAFRNRWATLEIRVTPETASTVESIAKESGRSKNDLLYAMLTFALANHNWRDPTYSVRLPTVLDLQATDDYFVESKFSAAHEKWLSVLRDKNMVIVSKARFDQKRPVKLTWQDFEPLE